MTLDEKALAEWDDFIQRVTDIPCSDPHSDLSIQWAGVVDVRVPIRLTGFPTPLTAVIDAGCCLSPAQRGVHMSRFVEEILSSSALEHAHILDLVKGIAARASARHSGTSARAKAAATGQIPCSTPQTNLGSLREFRVLGESNFSGSACDCTHGISVQILTACPCTQAFSRYELARKVAEKQGLAVANELFELFDTKTHVQRAWLTCRLQDGEATIGTLELVRALSEVLTMPELLLKRVDEHAVVDKCHARPQFTEDVVRDAAAALTPLVQRLPMKAMVMLKAVAHESIHYHSACAVLQLPAGELLHQTAAARARSGEAEGFVQFCSYSY